MRLQETHWTANLTSHPLTVIIAIEKKRVLMFLKY
jgi:hypothetical protein